MGSYKLSSKAEIDLASMYEFGIYKFGLLQAKTYFYARHDLFKVLAENVNLGRDASEFFGFAKRFDTFKEWIGSKLDGTLVFLLDEGHLI